MPPVLNTAFKGVQNQFSKVIQNPAAVAAYKGAQNQLSKAVQNPGAVASWGAQKMNSMAITWRKWDRLWLRISRSSWGWQGSSSIVRRGRSRRARSGIVGYLGNLRSKASGARGERRIGMVDISNYYLYPTILFCNILSVSIRQDVFLANGNSFH